MHTITVGRSRWRRHKPMALSLLQCCPGNLPQERMPPREHNATFRSPTCSRPVRCSCVLGISVATCLRRPIRGALPVIKISGKAFKPNALARGKNLNHHIVLATLNTILPQQSKPIVCACADHWAPKQEGLQGYEVFAPCCRARNKLAQDIKKQRFRNMQELCAMTW